MSNEIVDAWAQSILAVPEVTWLTTPNPVAAQALEAEIMTPGPSEVGNTRGQKDRNTLGRGMQKAFVEGRVPPTQFGLETSVKSRAAVDTVPRESALMKMGGLLETVNSSTSVVYTTPAEPIMSGAFASASLYRMLGNSPYVLAAEQLQGCIAKTLTWEGGADVLRLKVAGAYARKYSLGYCPSISTVSGADTDIALINAGDSYYFAVGWYQCESEIFYVSAVNDTTNHITIARAQLSSSGATHTTVPARPYQPSLTYAGSPVSEAVCSGLLDSIAIEYQSFMVALTTGMDHKPGESGSKWAQGAIAKRTDVKASFKALLRREDVRNINKAVRRKSVPLSFVSGGTAGGIVTFSMPTCEIEPITMPDNANDVVNVDVSVRVRDGSGNDSLSITYT